MAYTVYTTKEGESWAGIAFKAYGDVSKLTGIIEANPYIPSYPILPGGITLRVPILEEAATNQNMLPPWKR